MSDDSEQEPLPPESRLGREVGAQEARKLKARRQVTPGIWFGLGMMGLVGWSVAIPTLIGAVLGLWLDRRYPGPHSWTLALLVAGLVIGCWNAWHWVAREEKEMHERADDDEP
jgi:ATP synthase protein I